MATQTQSRSLGGGVPPEVLKAVLMIALLIGGLVGLLLYVQSVGPSCSIGSTSCFKLVQLVINGLLVGGVYALVGLGLVVINKASGVFNFAHGFMMLFGGWLFWQAFTAPLSEELSFIFSIIAGSIPLILAINRIDSSDAPPDETRAQRWTRIVNTPYFIGGLVLAIIVGAITFWLLRNLNDETLPNFIGDHISAAILRGTLGAVIGSAAIGLLTERFAIRPLLGQPTLTAIMMTLAVGLILQGATSLFWGTQPGSLPVFVEPAKEQVQRIPIGVNPDGTTKYLETVNIIAPTQLPDYQIKTEEWLGDNLLVRRNLLWGFVICILCFLAFVLFFQFTTTGLAMRAVAENQVLAESVGLRVRTILAVAWAIAGTMAMIAGVIQATGTGVSVIVIPSLAFRAFPAVLLGGLESITGALIGGLIIGLVEQLTIGLVDSSTGQEFAPFLALLIVLMIRPDGLFGQRRIDRV